MAREDVVGALRQQRTRDHSRPDLSLLPAGGGAGWARLLVEPEPGGDSGGDGLSAGTVLQGGGHPGYLVRQRHLLVSRCW